MNQFDKFMPKTAASKPPKDSGNKKEPAPTPKKRRPPEGGLGALVRK